jgi:hypothetical protein
MKKRRPPKKRRTKTRRPQARKSAARSRRSARAKRTPVVPAANPEIQKSSSSGPPSSPQPEPKPEPKQPDKPEPKPESKPAPKRQRSAEAIADEESCRQRAYQAWAGQNWNVDPGHDRINQELAAQECGGGLIVTHLDAIRASLDNDWPLDPALQDALGKAPEKIAVLAEKIAEKLGKTVRAAEVKRDDPKKLWNILRRLFRIRQQSQQTTTESPEFLSWVTETIDRIQPQFADQERYRLLDDLDDEEARIETNIWKQIDGAINKAAEDFKMDPEAICEALLEGFRTHPKLAPVVDEIPGIVIKEVGNEFRVTKDPYAVWARVGGRVVFTWGRILKVALLPSKHSHDENEEHPLHHFHMMKKRGTQLIEKGIVIRGELVVKGSPPREAIKELRRLGARVYMRAGMEKEYRTRIMRFLDWEPTNRIGKRLSRAGWNVVDGEELIARPDLVVRDRAPALLDRDPEPAIEYELASRLSDQYGLGRAGTADGWRAIAAPFAKDSNVVFFVGIFCAAPLLKWVSEPSRMYNSSGLSKIGKSAQSQIAQAFVGKPFRRGVDDTFGVSWNLTENRLLELCFLRNDFGVPIDEAGVQEPKTLANLAYTVASGRDRGRWHQREKSFSSLGASNSEPTFLEIMSAANRKVMPGMLMRWIDIPAEVRPGSAFETVPGFDDPEHERVCKQIYDDTIKHYGEAGLEWQYHLAHLKSAKIREQADHHMRRWRDLVYVKQITARVPHLFKSVIAGFALIAAALAMAGEAGILPATWTRETIDAMIAKCMERWVGLLIEAEQHLREKIMTGLRTGRYIQVRKIMEGSVTKFAADRPEDTVDFARWRALIDDRERDGFVKIERDGTQRRICIPLATFETMCGGREQARELARRFQERGWLDHDADLLTKNETIEPGISLRCYVLKAGFVVKVSTEPEKFGT